MHDMNKTYTTQARLPDGTNRYLEAPAGWRLMEVLRDYGVPVNVPDNPALSSVYLGSIVD